VLKASNSFGDQAWLRIQFNLCRDFQRHEPQVLSPVKYHQDVGNLEIPSSSLTKGVKPLKVSQAHQMAGVGEELWRPSHPAPLAGSAAACSPGPRVCRG